MLLLGAFGKQKRTNSERTCPKWFFRNVLPSEGAEHFFAKHGPKTDQKSNQSGPDRLKSDRVGPNPGPIRFWAGPCAKLICFAEPNARPSNPDHAGTHRNPPGIAPAQSKKVQDICKSRSSKCASHRGRGAYFQRKGEKKKRKHANKRLEAACGNQNTKKTVNGVRNAYNRCGYPGSRG